MCISTSHYKGVYATAIVQCAAACKWLQSGSGLVDAFLTGLVDACVNLPRYAPTLVKSSYSELQRTPGDVRPFTKATPRKINQRGKKRARSRIPTDTPEKNALRSGSLECEKNHEP